MIRKTHAIVGDLVKDNNMGDNIGNYIKTGAVATVTAVDGSLELSNGNNTIVETLEANWYTTNEGSYMSIAVKPMVTAANAAIAIRLKAVQTGIVAAGIIFKLDLSNTATRGRLSMGGVSFGTYTESDNSGADLIPFVDAQDTLIMNVFLSRLDYSTLFTVTNQRGYSVNLKKLNRWFHVSVSRPCITTYAGTQRVNNLLYGSTMPVGVDFGHVGDSLTSDGGVVEKDSMPRQMARRCQSSQMVCGTPGASTAEILLIMPELLKHRMSRVGILLGSNDANPTIARSAANYFTNLNSIINGFLGAGTAVTVFRVPPAIQAEAARNALIDQYNALIDTLTGVQIIDLYALVSMTGATTGDYMNPVYYAGDGGGVHFTAAAYKLFVDKIQTETSTILNW